MRSSRIRGENYEQSVKPTTLKCQSDSGNVSSTTTLQPEYRCALCSVSYPTKSHIIRHLAVIHDMLHQTTKNSKFLYECPTCGKEFSDLSKFKSHLWMHQRRKYNCLKCTKVYWRRAKLDKHCLSEHGVKGPTPLTQSYKCDQCDGIFTNLNSFSHHRISHKPPQISCDDCDRKFFTKNLMLSHAKQIHGQIRCSRTRKIPLVPPETKVSCQHCSMQYVNADSLRIHMRDIHQPKEHKCSHCYEEFTARNELNRHLMKAHSVYVESYTTCKICLKVCKDHRGLASHMRFHGDPTHSCTQCPLKFYSSGILSHHVNHAHTVKYDMPARTNRKEIDYVCAVCCKPCGWKGNLQRHLKIHNSQPPQTCPVCQQTFNEEAGYRDHMRHKHPDPKSIHNCDICSKRFASHEMYLRHRTFHEKPKLACPHCPRRFYNVAMLCIHSRFHNNMKMSSSTNEYPSSNVAFGCAICSRKFQTRCVLRRHLYTHNHSAICCSKCDYQSYQKASLIRHLRRFH